MAALVLFLLAVLVIVVEAFITTIVFFISFYWIGFAVFFLAGAVPTLVDWIESLTSPSLASL